jgi:hypothetical protein
MEKWIINECPILSYDIEIFPIKNSSEIHFNRYISSRNQIQINNLQSNQDYQLNIKIHSQAGENIERISFRTINDDDQIKIKNQQILFIMLFTASFLLIIVFLLIIKNLLKKTGLYKRDNNDLSYIQNLELFVNQKRRLKPVLYSNKSHRHYHKTWVKTENDFTTDNYIKKNRSDSFASGIFNLLIISIFYSFHCFVEDSQGNINPYAVTAYTMDYKDEIDHGSFWKENKHNHCQLDNTGMLLIRAPNGSKRNFFQFPIS